MKQTGKRLLSVLLCLVMLLSVVPAAGAVADDYYLFGYINGANYGYEEDWENLGIYRFVNGELTVKFDQDSYVGIKAGNNTDWYMTHTYVQDTTGTFYNMNTGAGEKMFIPGGVTLTLTLTENSDDSLTISYYESTEEPVTEPATEPVTEPATEPVIRPAPVPGNGDNDGDGFFLYAKVPEYWGDRIYAYTWDSELVQAWGSWPGTPMTKNGEWYSIELPLDTVNIIVNSQEYVYQTEDLEILPNRDVWVEINDGSCTITYAEKANVSISGDVSSAGDTGGAVRVELWEQGATEAAYEVTTKNGTYTLENIAAGDYTMKVRKLGHVIRSYSIRARNTALKQDVLIRQLGDVNFDGKINVVDVAKLYSHIKGTGLLTDDYALECANINGGSLNISDVSLIYAHVKNTKRIKPGVDPEDIFVWTVDDFEGYDVVNLDTQEDTNFLVYAKNVQKLTSTASSNILISANEDTLTYIYSNPDAAMKALKPGDVFFVEGTNDAPNGTTVKVKNMSLNGTKATIRGETVEMEDIFEYVDIDMDVSTRGLVYDSSQLDEGEDIYVADPTKANAGARTARTGDKLYSKDYDPIIYEIALSGKTEGEWGTVGGMASGSVELSGSLRFIIDNIHLEMHYSPHYQHFSYDLTSDVTYGFSSGMEIDGSWKLGKNGKGIPLKTPKVWIPGTPIYIQCGVASRFEISGKFSSEMDYSQTYHAGVSYQDGRGLSGKFDRGAQTKQCTGSLEGSILLAVDPKLAVGLPLVVEGYMDASVGVEVAGEMEIWNMEADSSDDCLHGCTECIDGEINIVYSCGAGLRSDVLDWILDDEVELRLDIVPESRLKIADFYCAFPRDGGVDFGWGECPNKRWRVDVNVHWHDNEPIDGVEVAALQNGERLERTWTDSNGKGQFYLSNGDYEISANMKNELLEVLETKSVSVTVADQPREVTITLGTPILEPNIYLLTDLEGIVFYRDGLWGEVHEPLETFGLSSQEALDMILKKYPNAKVITSRYDVDFQVGDVLIYLYYEFQSKNNTYEPEHNSAIINSYSEKPEYTLLEVKCEISVEIEGTFCSECGSDCGYYCSWRAGYWVNEAGYAGGLFNKYSENICGVDKLKWRMYLNGSWSLHTETCINNSGFEEYPNVSGYSYKNPRNPVYYNNFLEDIPQAFDTVDQWLARAEELNNS